MSILTDRERDFVEAIDRLFNRIDEDDIYLIEDIITRLSARVEELEGAMGELVELINAVRLCPHSPHLYLSQFYGRQPERGDAEVGGYEVERKAGGNGTV